MELHKRYTDLPKINVSVLEILQPSFKDNPLVLLHPIVQCYNNEITKDDLNIRNLEMFRTILCYEYEHVVNSDNKHIFPKTIDVDLPSIESIFISKEQSRSSSETMLLYDIMLLEMVLYCSTENIKRRLESFHDCKDHFFLHNHDKRVLYIKIMECFLESLDLQCFLYHSIEEKTSNELRRMYLNEIKIWLTMKEGIEWRSIASIFPKIIKFFGHENTLPSLWNLILSELNDIKDTLTALCLFSDSYFPSNDNFVCIVHRSLYSTDNFWILVLEGLRSCAQPYRKQATFIMKKVVNYMDKVEIKKLMLQKNSIVPFMCNKTHKTNVSINDVKEKFFLLLEALEEKQSHLVAPALSHVSLLTQAIHTHAECGNCLDVIWLRCIFQRILQHNNNNIVKWGLSQACKLSVVIYNDEFLELFANILNNTFLYECQSDKSCPNIVNELAVLLVQRDENTILLNRFLRKCNQVNWGPIAIFYVSQAMELASSNITDNSFQVNELLAVKSLVATNLNMHSHTIRIATQNYILQILANSIKKINNLAQVTNTLSVFATNEAFARYAVTWNIMTKWLEEAVTEADAVQFIKNTCEEYQHQYNDCDVSTETFARTIFLLHDAGVILRSKVCPIERVLNTWLQTLIGIDIRPYVDIKSSLHTIEFIYHLQVLSTTGNCDAIINWQSRYINTILRFLLRNARRMPISLCYEDLIRFLTLITLFLDNINNSISEKDLLNYAEQFQKESIYILNNASYSQPLEYLCGLHILYHCQKIFPMKNPKTLYLPALTDINLIKCEYKDGKKIEGKILSHCFVLLTKLIHQYLTQVAMEMWIPKIDWFQNIMNYLEMGNEITLTITLTLKTLIDKKMSLISQNLENLKAGFTLCWKSAFENKRNKIFLPTIKNLSAIIVNSNFLALPDTLPFVNQFVSQLLEEGDNIPNLKKVLLSNMELLNVDDMKNFQESHLNCLLHGHAPRRDKRIENQANLRIIKYYKHHYSTHASLTDYNIDGIIRAKSIVLLLKIINVNIEYASLMLPLVIEVLHKYKNKRYFDNSYLHRIKHRTMQVLLLLEPALTEISLIVLQEEMCNLMILESNQQSVRLMQEWLLIRIFLKNKNLLPNLWKFFEKCITNRPGCTSSTASIVYHIAHLLSGEDQQRFIQKSTSYVAQCCLGQQFNMRLYNQVTLVKLYHMLKDFKCETVLSEYAGLYNATCHSLTQGNLNKNSHKLQEEFYFSVFHPLKDYNLQTIYFEFPRMCNLDSDELIAPEIFIELDFQKTSNHPMESHSTNDLMINFKVPTNNVNSTIDYNLTEDSDAFVNIQKKINPMKSYESFAMSDEFAVHPNDTNRLSHKKLSMEGMIVVASLIDRIPNLGGLARTCEIFGAKELIVANLNFTKEKEFQSLSVSAEKWISIQEVKPHLLQEYLLAKRNEGWCLVGAEQTASSINLAHMNFNKKTILVLGNEKAGIPPNLIPVLDLCVEIPQIGVIRSLNVHVTGAICLWQYINQHILA